MALINCICSKFYCHLLHAANSLFWIYFACTYMTSFI